jgi:hypothetical protein
LGAPGSAAPDGIHFLFNAAARAEKAAENGLLPHACGSSFFVCSAAPARRDKQQKGRKKT